MGISNKGLLVDSISILVINFLYEDDQKYDKEYNFYFHDVISVEFYQMVIFFKIPNINGPSLTGLCTKISAMRAAGIIYQNMNRKNCLIKISMNFLF